jgi:hypothetical protein
MARHQKKQPTEEEALEAAQLVWRLRAKRDAVDVEIAAAERAFSDLFRERTGAGAGAARANGAGKAPHPAAQPTVDKPPVDGPLSLRTKILQFLASQESASMEAIASGLAEDFARVKSAVYDMSSKRAYVERIRLGLWRLTDKGRERLKEATTG